MADRYVWPVILTQMHKQVSIKVSNVNKDYMSFISLDNIDYNLNYKHLDSLPGDDADAVKLASITKHLTVIVRAYLAGKADWQEVESALRCI